jgi:hypothetical protein
MGFKPWRNLGVLALAGASLVGCATPQTTKLPVPPAQNNSYNVQPGQAPPPPNPFGTSQLTPSANGGFDNQQRQTVQGGFQQTGGPANPNPGFNTSSGAQNSYGNNSPPPSNPANSAYITAPNGGLQQPFNNSGLQGNTGNVGTTGPQNPYASPQGGAAPPSLPQPPAGFTPPNPGGFTPPPAPTGFGTAPR